MRIELNKKYKLKELIELHNNITGDTLEYKKQTNCIKALVKELERYYQLIEDGKGRGKGFIITEVYSTPKEKQDNRGKHENSHKHSTSSYEELEYLILNYINNIKKDNTTIYVTNNILASETITNNNYYFCMRNQKYFNIYMKKLERLSNTTITKDLFQNINISCKGIIQTSLKSLWKKYKLIYDYNYIIIENVEDAEGNIIDKTKSATKEEIEIIDITTKNYIEKFNEDNETKIKNLNDVCYLKQELYNKFYDELNVEVFEALYKHDNTEITMYFKGYIIQRLDNIDEILKDINIKEIRENLNQKFIKNSINNMIRQIERKETMINEYIDKRIEEEKWWGLVDEYTIEKVAKNKFGYHDVLMIKDKYKNEYIDILKFILDINGKDITMEIKRIIMEIKNKYEK